MEIKDARSLPTIAQEDLRRKAVKAVLSGKRQKEVAALFGVTEQAICQWMRRYRDAGMQGLKARRRGRPRGGKLLPWQAAQIAKSLLDRHPEQLKLPFFLWTREAVADVIEQKYGISVSLWTVGRYLKRWGFTPQKPVRRAFEQNPEAVKRWLEREYPNIRKKAKQQKAEIHWCDEMGVRSDHAAGRSYGLRGRTPVVRGTGQRFNCNMISAITNRGTLRFMVFRNRFDAAVFLMFLKRLLRQIDHQVFLIVDRHPAHRAKKVRAWVATHSEQIELFYLPPYSPELNPDEMLNQDVKSTAVRRRRPRTQKQMLQNVRTHLRARQRKPELVKKYFEEEHVRYAAM